MIGCIWAQSPEGIIGMDNRIPWQGKYPGDFRRFKRVTMGSTVVMGRKTWESIGRPLPGRLNVVITSGHVQVQDVISVYALQQALDIAQVGPFAAEGRYTDVWFIGGAHIYARAMEFADVLDVTYIPADGMSQTLASVYTFAPKIDESIFEPGSLLQHEDEPALKRREYRRRKP